MIHKKLIILGSGPAGYTAAVYAARANLEPVIITGMQQGGQLTTTTDVDNWPGEDKGIMGPELMNKMELHAVRFGTEIIFDSINSVDFSKKPYELIGDMNSYSCDALIICTGASALYLGLESEERLMGAGVSGCATCDGFFFKNEKVSIVGGGNTAVEEAIYMSNIASHVTLIHRRDTLKAEPILQDKLFSLEKEGKVSIIWNHEVDEIMGDDSVTGLRLKSHDGKLTEVSCNAVFIAIGHKPNTDMFKDYLSLENGYIVTKGGVHEMSTQTSLEGIFAAGDVADPTYKQAITSASSGCKAALDAMNYLQ